MSRMKKARPLNVTPGKPLLILIVLFLTGVAIQQCSEFFDPAGGGELNFTGFRFC